jgi:large subunit ribosomal protein L20
MRTKTGKIRRRRHNKVLKATKGYRMTKSKLYKVAHEAYMHAGQYAFAHRRRRHSQMRRVWISRITAASEAMGMKYKDVMGNLKKADVKLNRKMLSEIALNMPEVFTQIVKSA